MLITEISPQIRHPKRYSVFVDGEFAFGLDEIDLLYYGLEPGAELTRERLDQIADECVFQKARDKALRLLSARPRTVSEIRARLRERGEPEGIISRVIEFLSSYGYLGDEKYAADFLESAAARGLSARAAAQKLRERGVPAETAREALAEAELDEGAACLAALKKRFRRAEPDENARRKAADFLARKGFGREVIKNALKEFSGD